MPRIKVILNPNAGHGHAARLAPQIRREFTALGADFDLVHTTGPGDAIDLAHRALDDDYDTIVAVGGDGTSHEVVNGMMAQTNGAPVGVLGCIPAGSGNDFAVMNGTPKDLSAACRQIVQGRTQLVDVGQVTIDGRITRYFDNAVGIGFDGLVSMETRRYKRLRGMALYIPVVLKTVFISMRPPRVRIEYDGQIIEQTTLMTVICNGRREGGSFLVAPQARSDDGLFDLVITENMPKLQILGFIPRFMAGSHVGDRRVQIKQAREIVVTSDDPLVYHVDGEILSTDAHRIEVRMLPGHLRMIAPPVGP